MEIPLSNEIKLRIRGAYFSQEGGQKPGENTPHANEDSVLDPLRIAHWTVAAINDGMGGHDTGNVASQLATKKIHEGVRALATAEPSQATAIVKSAIEAAGTAIADQNTSERKSMGSTSVVAALHDGGELVVANCGDSRAYKFRPKNLGGSVGLTQLTVDQSALTLTKDKTVNGKREQMDDTTALAELDKMNRNTHPNSQDKYYNSGLTSYLGITSSNGENIAKVQTYSEKVDAGEYVVLFSDGITDLLTTERIEEILEQYASDLDGACKALCEEARAIATTPDHPLAGRTKGYLDDASVVILATETLGAKTESPPPPPPPPPVQEEEREQLTPAEIRKIIRIEGSKSLDDLYKSLAHICPLQWQNTRIDSGSLINLIETAIKTGKFDAIPPIFDIQSLVQTHESVIQHTQMRTEVTGSILEDASSLPALYTRLRELKTLGNYSAEEIITRIEAYLNNEIPSEPITRDSGLRWMVEGYKKVLEAQNNNKPISVLDSLSAQRLHEFSVLIQNAHDQVVTNGKVYTGKNLAFYANRALYFARMGDWRYINDLPEQANVRETIRKLVVREIGPPPVVSPPRPAESSEPKGNIFNKIAFWRKDK